jgi:hypothetical protein
VTHGAAMIGQARASRARVLDGALESRVRVLLEIGVVGVHWEDHHHIIGAAGVPAKVASPSHPSLNAPAGVRLLGDLLLGDLLLGDLLPGAVLESLAKALLENLAKHHLDLDGLQTRGLLTVGQAPASQARVHLEVGIGAADPDGVLLK